MKFAPRVFVFLTLILGGSAVSLPAASACSWSVVPSPNFGTDSNRLTDVSASSNKEAWAVGQTLSSTNRLLALHWNGSTWKLVPVSQPKGVSNIWLNGVLSLAPDDAWAVGEYLDVGTLRPLIRHWDGKSWRKVKPPAGTAKAGLNAIAEGANGELWAVGTIDDESLIIRWDGTSWRKVSHPDPGTVATILNDIARVPGSKQLWAVGVGHDASNSHPLMLLWNGRKWIHKTGPSTNFGELNGVSALAKDSVWVVGTEDGFNFDIYLTEYWDGATWYKLTPSSPSGLPPGNTLNEVVVLSDSSAFAAGHFAFDGTKSWPAILEWVGFGWADVSATTPSLATAYFEAIARFPGSSKLWAVGATASGPNWETLVERCS